MARRHGCLTAVARFVGVVILAAVLVPAAVLAYWLVDLPPLKALEDLQPATASVLVTRDGEPLAEFSKEYRELTSLRELPQLLVHAVLAAEDWHFYSHMGIDPQGLGRAMLTNLRSGKFLQGGSTITQQLTKVLLLTSERTLRRKLLELVLTLEIEQTYSKDQILELYLNTVYFGQGAYGVKTATEVFFSKDPVEVTIAEAALLGGMIRAPAQYGPVQYPERARARRNLVLSRMFDRGAITAEEYEVGLIEPLGLRMRPAAAVVALDFTEAVR